MCNIGAQGSAKPGKQKLRPDPVEQTRGYLCGSARADARLLVATNPCLNHKSTPVDSRPKTALGNGEFVQGGETPAES